MSFSEAKCEKMSENKVNNQASIRVRSRILEGMVEVLAVLL